jgi:CheY-like chemotaxis protein
MASRAQDKGLELILDLSRITQPMVKGDPGRVRQVITNLVGNAIKFTEQGEVVISAQLTELEENRLQLQCSISDTGIGIPTDKLDSLFNSFTQVDASTTRKYGGTGLGLAIVSQLCQLMNGQVSVTSEPGAGSCFSVTLELETSDKTNFSRPQVEIKDCPILIVDDNATNREVLRGQLEVWGAHVTEASDGHSCLSILEQHALTPFKIAILDMQMPGMNGATLGRTIREDARWDHTKMIMMTSMSERGDAQYFADLGFAAYFPKPATTSDLFDALAIVLDDGEALQQAQPLLTRHHIHSIREHTAPLQGRILLAEDNTINQEVALGVLADMGLNADVAANGLEVLEALRLAPEPTLYDLILMDCQMPEMDGYAATEAIRRGDAGPHYSELTIIAMTANAMKGDKEKCIASGMNNYLTKPIDGYALEKV